MQLKSGLGGILVEQAVHSRRVFPQHLSNLFEHFFRIRLELDPSPDIAMSTTNILARYATFAILLSRQTASSNDTAPMLLTSYLQPISFSTILSSSPAPVPKPAPPRTCWPELLHGQLRHDPKIVGNSVDRLSPHDTE